jgi:hypothetical protein
MTDDKSKIPETIRKDIPKQSYEMPGPGGQSVRQERFEHQLAKDRETAQDKGKNNFVANERKAFVISKENVRERTSGRLKEEFSRTNNRNNDKDRGR